MYRITSRQLRPIPASNLAVCLPCLAVMMLLAASISVSAAEIPDRLTMRAVPVQVVGNTSEGTAGVTIEDTSAKGTLVALDPGDAGAGIGRTGALLVGQGLPTATKRPTLRNAPGLLAVAGLLLIPLDKKLTDMIPRTPMGEKSDRITEAISSLGNIPVLAATVGGMYLLGNARTKDTAKLLCAALLTTGLATESIKRLAGRARPGVSGDETIFRGPGGNDDGYKSFPSGHAAATFAMATVLADRDPKQKWLYYGLAAAVGYARVRKSAHFPSDVLVGAAVGIAAGNSVLVNGPRFLSIKF